MDGCQGDKTTNATSDVIQYFVAVEKVINIEKKKMNV